MQIPAVVHLSHPKIGFLRSQITLLFKRGILVKLIKCNKTKKIGVKVQKFLLNF